MATDALSSITNHGTATQDLKLAQDSKRDSDTRHKYKLGLMDRPTMDGYGGRPAKPAQPMSKRSQRAYKRAQAKELGAHAATVKNVGKHRAGLNVDDLFEATTSGTDESIREPSPAPDPEAAYTYSFDAPRGASQGGEVLGAAIAQAVERFETRETQKLVDAEYAVIGRDGDEEAGGGGYTADQDDFELI